MMSLLDQITTIEKCLTLVKNLTSNIPLSRKIKQVVNKASDAIDNIKVLAGEISYKRTILTHQQMSIEDQRSIEFDKSTPRSSNRHASKLRKRKLSELSEPTLRFTLMDLRQSGRLETPLDLCKVIHGDDYKEQKKKGRWFTK